MKKIIVVVLIFICIFQVVEIKGNEPYVSARAAILIDSKTGSILYEKNAYEKLPMASTTKIITAITAIDNGNVNDIVTVSRNASYTEGSSVYLREGEKISLSNLLYALMLESGNDAAVAIAEHISGNAENFALLMNETCKKAGATDTNCINPNGLHDDMHFTTARDLAIITSYALKNDLFRKIVATEYENISSESGEQSRSLTNHNKLLKTYDGAIGVKTGYTKKAGRCLVSAAKRGEIESIAVTLNAPDDWNDHKAMLEYSFNNFGEMLCIVKANEILGTAEVLGNKNGKVSYCTITDFNIRKISSNIESVEIKHNIDKNLKAPIQKGEIIGSITVKISDTFSEKLEVVATEDVPENDMRYILWDNYRALLEKLLSLVR